MTEFKVGDTVEILGRSDLAGRFGLVRGWYRYHYSRLDKGQLAVQVLGPWEGGGYRCQDLCPEGDGLFIKAEHLRLVDPLRKYPKFRIGHAIFNRKTRERFRRGGAGEQPPTLSSLPGSP